MSFNKLILFAMIINLCLNEEKQPPSIVEELICGKDSPKKEEDCTKYGTGSGMLCCWVATDENDKNGKCYLVSETLADNAGIDGKKSFTTSQKYFSCGNKSYYLNYNIIMILLILLSL